jgi:DNA-binding transcriptional LysR family regulator
MVNQSITFWLTSRSVLLTERGMYVLSLARNLLQQCKICL